MWEQIAANHRRSMWLIALMGAILLLLGFSAGMLLGGPEAGYIGIILAFLIWLTQMGVYFLAAESVLLHGAHAREISREESPRLHNIVEEMCLASGLGYTPKIYLLDDPAPNAFAIGRKPKSSAVAVTTGLMHRLNRDELQGVIAHEVAHLKNQDVKFMTLAAVMLGSIVILSEVVWHMMRSGGRFRSRSSSRGGGQAQPAILLFAILLAVLAPLLAQLLYFACSRKREYLADASAVQFTRYPEGLAGALEKIAAARGAVSFASKATAPMFIINPLTASGERESVFSTHPPTAKRIRILRSMGNASLADYEAAYRNVAGEGLLGPATLQSSTQQVIREPSNEGPIASRREIREAVYRANGYLHLKCSCGLTMLVPESFERNEVVCIRCGSTALIPSVAERQAPSAPNAPPVVGGMLPPLHYTRLGSDWETFRCACGRTQQLSPAFAAPQITCNGCKRVILVQPVA